MQLRLTFSISILCLFLHNTHAQNWVNGGNTLSANGTLGTNSSHSLLFKTSGLERGRITNGGNWGIGTASPIGKFHVNGVGSFGSRATPSNATRVLNLADDNAVMRILRTHASFAPAVELISRTTADGPNVAYWDFYAEPSDKSFRIRDRVGGGSGLDRLIIKNNGNVGIGTTEPAYPLHVESATTMAVMRAISTYSGLSSRAALYARSVNAPGYGQGVHGTGGGVGVTGIGEGGSYTGYAFGVYAYASGNAGSRYGIYASACCSPFDAAGYFDGTVWAGSYHTTSDRKFKTEVAPLENILSLVTKLRPSTYRFKTGEFRSMHFPKGRQIGLIADEVKQVFPELVEQAVHPAKYEENDRTKIISPEVTYEGVNYQGLIPVLIASVQELSKRDEALSKENQELKKRIDDLQARLLKLEALLTKNSNATVVDVSSAYLEQNAPNPVRGNTTIRYHIPDNATSAGLTLTNAKGQVVKTISIPGIGKGQLNLNTQALAAGAYSYSLVINGKITDTKQLIIAQ